MGVAIPRHMKSLYIQVTCRGPRGGLALCAVESRRGSGNGLQSFERACGRRKRRDARV